MKIQSLNKVTDNLNKYQGKSGEYFLTLGNFAFFSYLHAIKKVEAGFLKNGAVLKSQMSKKTKKSCYAKVCH